MKGKDGGSIPQRTTMDSRTIKAIANLYLTGTVVQAPKDLAQHIHTNSVKAVYTDVDPYPTALHLFADLEANRPLYVYAGGTCPDFLDPATNRVGRAYHDTLHFALRADFQLGGEIVVARYCASKYPELAWYYACEIVGQAAVYTLTGIFPEQRLVKGIEILI